MSRDESRRSGGRPVRVDPVPGERAATADLGGERALLIADYHAGVEVGLRHERGVDVPSRAEDRRERLLALVERTDADRLVVLGDLMHAIGDPGGAERGELEVLFESLPPSLAVTLVKGNHDGAVESWLGGESRDDAAAPGDPAPGTDRLTIVPGAGVRLGDVGVCHGHTWPAREVLEAEIVCVGHEHPFVRLEDEIGGGRAEPAWLRGPLDPGPFRDRPEYDGLAWLADREGDENRDGDGGGTDARGGPSAPPELIVVPAFNGLVGGTWLNVPGQSFLAPFLPDGLADAAEAYLLDGTRLGPYRSI